MNLRKLSAAVLRLALAFVCAPPPRPAQEAPPAPTPKPSEVFRQAAPVNGPAGPDPAAFEFELNGFSYRVRQNGNGWRKKGDRTRRFNLRLDDGGLGRVYFHDYGGRLLLVCEVGDGESGGGFVTLLEQPSMRALWKQTFPAFNVGEPLREGRHLYVTGAGFVGKLSLDTGEFDWKHDLYETRAGAGKHFASFETPELAGDAVLFRERPVYNPGKTLVVNRKSGKVMRVE